VKPKRRVKTGQDQNGKWWVITLPHNDALAGPYETRAEAPEVKARIQEALGG
jgi:hypothetical protein